MSSPPARRRQDNVDAARPVPCHYADEPARRPACTLTAEVRPGDIPLCHPCARARSTPGKGLTPLRLPPSPPIDVLDWVTNARAAAGQAQRHLDAAVTRARLQGHTWTEIADRLGTTRQAAQQRFGHDPSRKG